MDAIELLQALGPIVSPAVAILGSAHLTNYRLAQLEKKVEENNHIKERTTRLEGRMNEAEHDIRDIKKMIT